jgi:streptogramin lyase
MINKLLNTNFIISLNYVFLFILLSIMIITVTYENYAFAANYNYAPFFTATGSNKLDIPDSANLRLSSFTVATWFKTTATFPDEGVMVNKGGLGSESTGANQNYGIWFTPSERLQGGFETTGGSNRYITSANTYNDGQWHHGVVTFDNSNNIVRLFVDGVQIGTLSTSSNPDNTGSQPLRIAGNAQSLTEDFFVGQLDEVGVWNRALNSAEIINLKDKGVFAPSGLVYSNSFGLPPPQEICDNGIDDDGDGLVDTADPDCQTPEICNDNIDNDGDGFIDAADTDCQQYCFDFQWGSEGTGNGQFIRPHDVVFDSSGVVYVLDRSRADVQKFTPGGQFISKFGSAGSDPGEFLEPYSMLIDSADNLYIVDKENDRIQKLTTNGIPLSVVGGFSSPEDMDIDQNGNFYVTDTGADRIVKLDQNFSFIFEFGTSGDGPGQFDHPHAIGVDSVGNLYVNDAFSPRIQKFTNDGFFIKQWGSLGTGDGQFTLPLEHLEVDSTDKVFMIDSESNPRVQLFDTEGNFITKFGEPGSGAGELDIPEHLSVDTQGNVYVVDRGDQTMKVFKQCPALPISSSEGSGFSTTTEDQIFPSLPANDTAEINPIKKSQQPFSNLTTTKDLLSRLPSMMSPFNLQ